MKVKLAAARVLHFIIFSSSEEAQIIIYPIVEASDMQEDQAWMQTSFTCLLFLNDSHTLVPIFVHKKAWLGA